MWKATYNALAEHIPRHWSLWWCNAKALAENATIVRRTRSVPQKPAIAFDPGKVALLEAVRLTLTFDTEDVADLIVHGVSRSAGFDQILADFGELLRAGFDRHHLLHAETFEVRVERMHRVDVVLLHLNNLIGVLEVREAVHEVDLTLQGVVMPDYRRAVAAEGVRYV